MDSPDLYLGIDLGTSGCRAICINDSGEVFAEYQTGMPIPERDGPRVEQDPEIWWLAVCDTLDGLLKKVDSKRICAIAFDGTSASLLACDAQGNPLGPALMYNDSRCVQETQLITQVAPANCAAHGVCSSLAKLMYLQQRYQDKVRFALHQADWLSNRFANSYGKSDYNNCLKLGYDLFNGQWPTWMHKLGINFELLPEVIAPGAKLAEIDRDIAERFKLSPTTQIVFGTTDSIAAFRATGAASIGDAVTSLGSTLVVKILSDKPVFSSDHGVYSHRLDDKWLVGGASNSGGNVLKKFFSQQQIDEMSKHLEPYHPLNLDYYPLTDPGERFPVNDPDLAPRLSPRPEDDVKFFQAILEGIAGIEYKAYRLLEKLGAPYPISIRSVGGGAKNLAWNTIRENLHGTNFLAPLHHQAAYGAALLASRNGHLTH